MEWRNFLWFKSTDISVDICKFRSHWCFMLSSCFRFSSHRTCHVGFVSSTDAMIGGQAGWFSESTAFIQRIIDSSFALVRLVWQFKSVKSLAIQCLDLWHCIFEHCSFWYGSETILFACAAYVEGQRPSGCSPTSRPSSPTSRPTCSLSMPRQSMKSMTVSSMEASALSPGALGHSMTPVAGLGPVASLGPATGELLCPSLPSFLRVSPFRKTQDPMVDARLDCLYRDACAMEKLDEVDETTRPCRK